MGRLLDEDDVIDAVAKLLAERCGGNTVWWKPVAEAVVNNLPSAQPSNGACWGCQCEKVEKLQPEREKGKWIVCGDKHVCSECDEFALCDAYDVLETGEYQEKLSDFCPNCGADMREGQDERHD